jgi:hypothetical protein
MTASRGGKVAGDAKGLKAQHVDLFRKVQLRKLLLRALGPPTGAIYVPFCGDGDLAVDLDYAGTFGDVLAADLDPERTATFARRIPGSLTRTGDCDTAYPFADVDGLPPLAAGDFDAYSHPYRSFAAAWESATWADRALVLFTDAQKMTLFLHSWYTGPDGNRVDLTNAPMNGKRAALNFYIPRVLDPWLRDTIAARGYRVIRRALYRRGMMVYWGAVIER